MKERYFYAQISESNNSKNKGVFIPLPRTHAQLLQGIGKKCLSQKCLTAQ